MNFTVKDHLRSYFILLLLLLLGIISQAQVPGSPDNLVLTPINGGGMIQFTTPTNIGGSAITNYEGMISKSTMAGDTKSTSNIAGNEMEIKSTTKNVTTVSF